MEHCQICGKAYKIVYDVPDKIWNKITPKERGAGLLCIECADKKAHDIGIKLYWSANEGRWLQEMLVEQMYLNMELDIELGK